MTYYTFTLWTQVLRKIHLIRCFNYGFLDPWIIRITEQIWADKCLKPLLILICLKCWLYQQALTVVLIIMFMLYVPSIFFMLQARKEDSDNIREKFQLPESNHLTLFHIYNQWQTESYSSTWCMDHFVHAKATRRVREVHAQLKEIIETKQKYRLYRVEQNGT